MPMRVSELVRDPELGLRVLVERDLERTVRWVHTTELTDPSRYLQGGEVILTTGVWIAAGTSAPAFVRPLARAGVAALGYGLPAPGAGTPPDLVAACAERDLTLFSVPFELPFIAIGERFVERLAADRQHALEQWVVRSAALVRAAEHGAGLHGVLRVLARSVEDPWVIGSGGRVLAAHGDPPDAAEVAAVAAEAARLQPDYPVRAGRWLLFPVATVGRTDAHLAVPDGGRSRGAEARAAIDQALPFLGLELTHRRALRESERRFAAELVDLIAAGPAQVPAASARLEAFGLDPHRAMVGVVCEVAPGGRAVDAVEQALADAGVGGVAASKGAEVVAIAQWDGAAGTLADLGRAVSRALGPDCAVGVGGVADDAEALRTSLIEARQVCRFARLRRGGEAFATHDAVGSHMLLLALQDEEVLASFRRALLQPLEEHDARRRGELVRTLDAFLRSGGQWAATAAALHVHVNTLRHRLGRIEQLTGRSLASMEDRVDFFIALRARP